MTPFDTVAGFLAQPVPLYEKEAEPAPPYEETTGGSESDMKLGVY